MFGRDIEKTSQAEISEALQFSENSGNSNLTVQNLNRHNSDNSYKPSSKDTYCKLCSVDFKFDRVLRHHMKAVHGYVAPVSMANKGVRGSSVGYNQKPYCCTVCKLGFTSKNKCVRHLSKLHPAINDPNSCILVNGSSVLSESNSDLSEDSRSFAATQFNNGQFKSGPIPAHSGQNNTVTSRFAAVCEVAASNTTKPLNLTSKNVDDYDAGDESEDQPFDLSKSSVTKSHQPLNLTVHPLDLSKKPPNQEPKRELTDVVTAADVLLSFQSAASKAAATSNLKTNPFQAAMSGHGFFPSPFSSVGNQLFGPGVFPPVPPQPAQFVDNILKILSMNPIYAPNLCPTAPTKPVMNVAKNERNYSCKYCLAGFTLKSNMERHIKRKHPLYAKPSRRSSSSDQRERFADEHESSDTSPVVKNVAIAPPCLPNTLSNRTRAALRDVLNSKVIAAVVENGSVAGPGSSVSAHSPVPFDSDTQVSNEDVTGEVDVEANGDLASVSSLIDHTANSSQDLKKFLDSEESDDHPHPSMSPSNRGFNFIGGNGGQSC